MLRSISAVLGGYVAMAGLVLGGTAIAAAALVPGGLDAMRTPATGPLPNSYLSANVAVSLLAAVVGGWVAAAIAQSNAGFHVAALAALILLMGAVSGRTAGAKQPSWYPWAIPLVGVVGVTLGWALRVRVA
jgi:hypothetical protein